TCFSASRTCSSVTATVSTPFALWLHSKGCPAAAQLRRLRRRSPLPWPCRAPYNGGQIRQEPIGNGRRAGCTSQDKGGDNQWNESKRTRWGPCPSRPKFTTAFRRSAP